MDDAERCFVADCDRRTAASVTRGDLPGSLRLCATHTEQFRQSSDGWAINWPPGEPVPASVTAPSSDVLWAYRREPDEKGNVVTPVVESPRPGLSGIGGRAAGWLQGRRGGRDNPPKE